MADRVLLVGESNPYGADPRFALYPEPPGCAGARLCEILGMSKREYLLTFDRVNLLGGARRRWSAASAREAACALAASVETARYRVLLGARVAAAHGLAFKPFMKDGPQCGHAVCQCGSWLVLPHPSGRSRLWNEPGAAERARGLVLQLVEEARRG